MSRGVDISIIIPVYNAESYLSNCIASAVNQVASSISIEIICVDDGSTDSSLTIIQSFARRDRRVRVLRLSRNRGTCYARKYAVEQAKGKYLMFLDADDTLESAACETLFHKIEYCNVDILHFGTNLIPEGILDPVRVQRSAANLLPWGYRLEGKNILDGCFQYKLFRHTLWNKIFRTSVVQKAFKNLNDDYLVKAEDLYAFFTIAYYAESYIGLPEYKLYNYHLGRGITGRESNPTLAHLDLYCQNMCSVEALTNFVKYTGHVRLDPYYKEIFLSQLRFDMLMDCLSKYWIYLPEELREDSMPVLLKYWKHTELQKGFAYLGITI